MVPMDSGPHCDGLFGGSGAACGWLSVEFGVLPLIPRYGNGAMRLSSTRTGRNSH